MRGILTTLGNALKVLGVIVTGAGLRRTWREFPTGERFLAPVLGPPSRLVRRAADRWRSQIATWRGQHPRTDVQVGSAMGFVSDLDALPTAEYSPLPPGTLEDAIAALDARTQEIQTRLNDANKRLNESVSGLRDEAAERDANIAKRLDDLERSDVRLATGGIRLTALGLLLIGLGELAELIAPLFPE